ncbi:MAG: hypothetical protein KIT84_02985 [Labilithrix sp.]|nr:hypothetical protein [Labilithrix sp.]MCW5809947.1 hypothetical protein [Labilithrix sp.]
MNDMTDTTETPASLTLSVKRIRTHVRGGSGETQGQSAASKKIGSIPPKPHEQKANIAAKVAQVGR